MRGSYLAVMGVVAATVGYSEIVAAQEADGVPEVDDPSRPDDDETHAASPGIDDAGDVTSVGDGAGVGDVDTGDKPWNRGVSLERRKAARALFLQGNQLIKEPFFARAAARYREALQLWPHPAFHYNLAIAQINLNQRIAAFESLERAMAYGVAPLGEHKYRQALEYRKILEDQLARIVISCDEPGAEVTVDGARVLTGPGQKEVMVMPGARQLVATKPEYLTRSESIVVGPGEQQQIDITPLPIGRLAESRRWPAWKPWSLVGSGAVLSATGALLHWRAQRGFRSFDEQFDRNCVATGCPDASIAASLDGQLVTARWQQRSAYIAYGLGGTAVAVGSILTYLNRARLVTSSEAADEAALVIVPVATERATGVSAWFRF